MKNSDEAIIYNILAKSFAVNDLISLGTKFNKMPFDAFLKHKKIIQKSMNRLTSNLHDNVALADLKQELIPYKILYTIHHRKLKNKSKNKKKELNKILCEIPIDSILKLIAKAEVLQYNEYFVKKPAASRVTVKKLMSIKKPYRRLRGETLIMIYNSVYTKNVIRLQIEESLLENPKKLYPAAREMKRRFIIHCGTTNTGKTYNAIEALKSAETGAYLGPAAASCYGNTGKSAF